MNDHPNSVARMHAPLLPQPAILPYAGTTPHFSSGHTLSVTTRALLGISLLICVVSIGAMYMQVRLLDRANAGEAISPAEASSNDQRIMLIGLADLTLIVVTAIVFLVWLYRVTRNLIAFSREPLRFSPGWAVGYFFIPILNLFRPHQILSEAWKRSQPGHYGAQHADSPAVVSVWWGCWLVSGFISNFANRMVRGEPSIDELILSSWASIAADVVAIGAGVACLIMIGSINRLQAMKAMEHDSVQDIQRLPTCSAAVAPAAMPISARR